MNTIHVLLVEDNEADIELTRDMLAMNQFEIKLSVAKDGIEALEFLNGEGSWSEPGGRRSFFSTSICPARTAARFWP